jgi:hypothetical protein
MATVGCGDKNANDILAVAREKYPGICALVNGVVSGMNDTDTVTVMKNVETDARSCDIQNAGTNIKTVNSITTNICANKNTDDVIRFRIISDVEQYTDNYALFSKRIDASGASLVNTNFFTGEKNPYVGINIKYTYDDYPFEVQFHTTKSSDLATLLHPIYKSKEPLQMDDTTANAIKAAEATANAIKKIEEATKSGKSKSRRKRKRKRKTYRKRYK